MYHHVGLMGRETTPSLSDSLDDTIFTGMEAGEQRGGGEGRGEVSCQVLCLELHDKLVPAQGNLRGDWE